MKWLSKLVPIIMLAMSIYADPPKKTIFTEESILVEGEVPTPETSFIISRALENFSQKTYDAGFNPIDQILHDALVDAP